MVSELIMAKPRQGRQGRLQGQGQDPRLDNVIWSWYCTLVRDYLKCKTPAKTGRRQLQIKLPRYNMAIYSSRDCTVLSLVQYMCATKVS